MGVQHKRLQEQVDKLRAELAETKSHLAIALDNAAGWRKRTAERREAMKALRAHVERATEVIEKVKRMYDHPTGADADWGSLLCANAIAKTAVNEFVAATPAQSLASVKAAALREVARLVDSHACEILMAEADRIEKEGANG